MNYKKKDVDLDRGEGGDLNEDELLFRGLGFSVDDFGLLLTPKSPQQRGGSGSSSALGMLSPEFPSQPNSAIQKPKRTKVFTFDDYDKKAIATETENARIQQNQNSLSSYSEDSDMNCADFSSGRVEPVKPSNPKISQLVPALSLTKSLSLPASAMAALKPESGDWTQPNTSPAGTALIDEKGFHYIPATGVPPPSSSSSHQTSSTLLAAGTSPQKPRPPALAKKTLSQGNIRTSDFTSVDSPTARQQRTRMMGFPQRRTVSSSSSGSGANASENFRGVYIKAERGGPDGGSSSFNSSGNTSIPSKSQPTSNRSSRRGVYEISPMNSVNSVFSQNSIMTGTAADYDNDGEGFERLGIDEARISDLTRGNSSFMLNERQLSDKSLLSLGQFSVSEFSFGDMEANSAGIGTANMPPLSPSRMPALSNAVLFRDDSKRMDTVTEVADELHSGAPSAVNTARHYIPGIALSSDHHPLLQEQERDESTGTASGISTARSIGLSGLERLSLMQQQHQQVAIVGAIDFSAFEGSASVGSSGGAGRVRDAYEGDLGKEGAGITGGSGSRRESERVKGCDEVGVEVGCVGGRLLTEEDTKYDDEIVQMMISDSGSKKTRSSGGGVTLLSSDSEKRSSVRPTIIKSLSANSDSSQMSTSSLTSEALLLLEDYALQQERAEMNQAVADADASILYQQAHQYHHHHHQQQQQQQDQDQDQDRHRELMLMPISGDGLGAQERGANDDDEEEGEGFSSYYSYGVVPSRHSHPCSSSPSSDCTRHDSTAIVSAAVVGDAVSGSSRAGLGRRGGRGRGREAPLGQSSGFTSHEGSFTLVPDSTSSVVATAAAASATAGAVVVRGGATYGLSVSQAAGPDIMVRAASFTMSKPTSTGFDPGVGLPTRPVSRAESTTTSTYSTPHSSQLTSRSNSHSKSEDFVAFYPASQAHSRTNSRSEDSTVIGPPTVSSVASVSSGYPFSLLEASKSNSRELSSSCSAQHLPPSIHEHTAYPVALPLPPCVSAKPRPKTSAIQGMGVIGTNPTHSSAAGAVVKDEHLSGSSNNHINMNKNNNHFIHNNIISGIRNSSSCPEVHSAVGARIGGVTADTRTGAAMTLELKTEIKTEHSGTKTTENELKDGEGSKGEEGKKVSADEVARASKSLAAISAKFVQHFGENDIFQFLAGDFTCLTQRISAPDSGIPESVRVDAAAESLQVHVRRVYEVIKILEVLSLLSFSGDKRGKFSWLGTRDFLFTLGKLQVDAMSKYPEAAETYGLRKVTSSSGFLPPFEGTRLAVPTPQTQPGPTTSLNETPIQQLQQQNQHVGAVAVLDPEEQLRKTKLHEQAVSTLLFTSMESMDSFIISKSASHSAKHGTPATASAAAAANMDKRRGGAEGVVPFGAAGSSLNMTRTTTIPMTTIKMTASSATAGAMLQRERSRQSVPQHHHQQQRQQSIILGQEPSRGCSKTGAGKNNRGQPINSRGGEGSTAMDTDNDEEEEEEEEEYGDCVHPITAEDLMPSRDRDDDDSLAYSAGGRTSQSNSNSRSGGDIVGVPHVKTQHQERLLFPAAAAAATITPSLSIIPPDCVGVGATEGSGRRTSSSGASSAFPPTARAGSALPPSPLPLPHPRDQQAHHEQQQQQQQQRYSIGSVHSSGKSTGSRQRGSGLVGGGRGFERQESSDTAISTEDESELYNNSPFSRFSHTARTDDSETSEFDQHSNSTSSPARLMPFPRSLPSSYKSHDSINNSSNKTNTCNSHNNSNDYLRNASSRSSDGSFCGADQSVDRPGPPVARIAARANEIHPFQTGEQSCSVESQGSAGSTGSGSGIAPTVSKLTIESVKQLNLQNLGGQQMNKNNNNKNNNNSAQTSPKAVSGKSLPTVLKIQQRNHLLKSSVGASNGVRSLISNESTGSMSARSAHSAQSVHSLISAQSAHSLISVTSGLSVYTGYSESDLDGEHDPYGIPATAAASGAGAGNGTANGSEIMCAGAAVATSAAGGSLKVGMEGGGGANRKRNKPTTTPKKSKTTPTGDQHMVESFCKGFLQLFLVGLDGITLSYAIHALVPAKDGQKVEEYNKTNATKIRRIYDVANVLCSLNMMEKRSQRPLSGNASSLTAIIPLPAHQQMHGKHSNKSDNKALFWCSFPAKAIREAYLRDERSLLPMSASDIDSSNQALSSTQR